MLFCLCSCCQLSNLGRHGWHGTTKNSLVSQSLSSRLRCVHVHEGSSMLTTVPEKRTSLGGWTGGWGWGGGGGKKGGVPFLYVQQHLIQCSSSSAS
jgi:hypothetical protein